MLTGSQFAFPALLTHLERAPNTISNHEFWRFITPMFVHSDGWRQISFNFAAIAVVGVFVEWTFSRSRWLILYFVPGLAAETVALSWQPTGAGASVAGAGLLGAVVAWLFLVNRQIQARIGSIIVLVGGATLIFYRDIHGPPILLGAGIATFMLKRK